MRKLLIAALALSALGLAGGANAQINTKDGLLGPGAYAAGVTPPPKRPKANYDYVDPYDRSASGSRQPTTPRYGSQTPRANRYDPTLAPDSSYTPILKNYRDAPPVQRFKPQPRPVYPY